MISLAAASLPTGKKKGSFSHTFHKRKMGVQLFGLSDGCTPVIFLFPVPTPHNSYFIVDCMRVV